MANPGLEKKPFYGREWVFLKLAHCLEQRPVSKTCGAVIVGGPGSGKTALCQEMVWPGIGGICRAQRALRRRLLAYHFCQVEEAVRGLPGKVPIGTQKRRKTKKNLEKGKRLKDSLPISKAHNASSLSPAEFVRRIVSQLLNQTEDDSPPATGEADLRSPSYPSSFLAVSYADKIRKDADIQAVLQPDSIEREPDEALKKGILFPLLEIDPPKHCMFLLVDSIDEVQLQSPSGRKGEGRSSSSSGGSTTIAELLGSHHHLFPQWLMLICTSRRQSKNISKMFTGFRKVTLDDLRKSHVVRDVQQYILARVHSEDGLRSGMRRETVEMLNQLQIKSAGCFLYLERVLDGLRERLMLARDLKDIPGTLNGLYLWLCQRLFHSQHLPKVQPILNVILASRRPLTISEVYEAVWTHNTKMSRQSFTNRLQLLRRVLRLHSNGTLLLFHHSFAEWLLDVKHCTRKYLCSADDGHAMLAMSMTLRAKMLPPEEIQNFALHLTRIPLPPQNLLDNLPVDYNTLVVLWLVQSGAKVENCLLADEKPLVEVTECRKSKRVSKTKKAKDNQYEKLKESYEELEFEPYGRRDLDRKVNDDYDHLEFDLVKESSQQKEETGSLDKSPEFLKDIDEQNFKFSSTPGEGQNHVKLDSEDSGFLKSEDASTLGVTTTMSSSNELKENISRDEELELLLNGLEKSLNEDSFLSSVISLKPETDVPIPKDPTVLKILTEAGAKVSNCNSLSRDGGLSSQASRAASPEAKEVDPLQELLNTLNSDSGVMDGRLLHAVASQDNATLLQLVLTTYPELDLETEDRHGQTAVNLAARHGYLQVLEGLLDVGANVNHSDCEGWTALRAAAWGGHISVVELLLNRGADVDVADSDQRTALRAAAWGGHDTIVKLLVAHNADVNHTDDEGRTALIAASYMGHADIVEHLLDNGATIDHQDVDGRTALSVAALCVPHSEGYIKVVNLLLERGATVDHQDKDGMTPLLVAAFEGHRDVCELLLEYEADVDHADRSGRTPLWAAASMGHASVVNLLLFWGCYVDSIDNEGRTVLSVAAAQGNTAVVRQLVDRGLDEQHRDNSGWTPLHYAAFEGHLEVCEALLEGGSRVDEPDNDGKGALHLAAQEGHTMLVQALLEVYSSPPDQRAHDGKTPLRLAALEGHYEIVRTLLAHGADVNSKDADGRTTLYVLALENRLPMTRFLLEHGHPDVESRDTEGRTALHVSAWQGHFDMVRLLLTLGRADVNGVDKENRTALHSASWQGHSAIVQLLLDQGARPDHTCNQGATALGIAAQEGHEDCVRALLEQGADPSHSDHCGRNAFRVAAKSGHDAVVRLLQEHSSRMECIKPSAPEMSASFMEGSGCDGKYLSLAQHSTHSKSSSNLTNSTKSSQDQQTTALAQQQCMSFTQQLQMASSRGPRLSSTSEVVSPIYASPPHSPLSDINSPETEIPPTTQLAPTLAATDLHFARDTHMRIILGNSRVDPSPSQKSKRNGIVTNPALRLMSNVKNGLENAAERIQRSRHEVTRINLSRPRDSKLNGHWKKETPL